ncbi:hypothetical protein FRB96_002834 [Tulasnella sp. 330]|nr:hypothetical protein FRB96_002834 [Tulasnella sp. 330]
MLLQNIAQPGLVASSRHTGEDKYPNLRKSASHEDSDDPGKPEPDGEVPTLTRRKTRGYEIDPELERKVMRKVDWRLIPILSALFGFGLIDRNNIGLVRVSGMDEALGLSIGNRFTIVTVVMLIPLILFDLPSNIALRYTTPRVFITLTAFAWGVVIMCSGFVKSWKSLVVMRVLLGAFEAGFLPAVVYLFGVWYTREEVQTKTALWYSVTVFIGAFSGILAYGFSQMNGLGGIAGWSWIYIMEGLISIVISFAAWFLIVDFPDDNKFLTAEETELVLARIDNDRGDAEFDSLTWPKTVKYFFEAKLWGFAVLFGCASVPSYAIVTFLPIILEGMDFTIVKTQLLGAPPMLFTFVYMVVCAKISDRLGVRAPFLVLHAAVCIAGLVMVGWCTSNASSSSPQLAVFFSELEADWRFPLVVQQNNNIIGQSKRAYSAALSSAFSGIGGIIASTVFRQQDFPLYRPGIIVSIASQVLTILLAGVMTFGFHLRNSKVKRRMSETLIEGRTGFLYTL